LPELVKQLFPRSPLAVSDSPTALLIACDATWNADAATVEAQEHRPDSPQLILVMVGLGDELYGSFNKVLKAIQGHNPRIGACDDTGHYLLANESPLSAAMLFGKGRAK
jgi:hypothetical protein